MYADDLYPDKYRGHDRILHNLRILLDWCREQNFQIPKLDLFTGEIWHTKFGCEVLDVIYDEMQAGLRCKELEIPTNCTFCTTDTLMRRMQSYIDRFAQIGARITISCSVEGAVIEKLTRPVKGDESTDLRTDEFYDRLFQFARKNHYLFHPMVASANVKYWPENFLWYREQCDNYDIAAQHPLMMLEVRNADWTEESLRDLCAFYDFQIDYDLSHKYNNNVIELANDLFGISGNSESGYVNYALPFSENYKGCTVPMTMTVRLGDLAIAPCHRTSYNKLLYGKFVVEDDKIVGLQENNVQNAIRILFANGDISDHGCDACSIKAFCMKGCYGSQYETERDMFMPQQNVCWMHKTKILHLLHKYEELGIIDYLRSLPVYHTHYSFAQRFLKAAEIALQGEEDARG
jgi:radical SAM protein with 4Fe4S-binding SPASM domain